MKRLVLSLLILISSFAMFCGETFDISIKPEIGILKGQVSEYVFASNKGINYTASRLDWDVDSILYGGLGVESVICKKFSISAGGKLGLPGRSGNMEDFDWMNITDLTRNTHYSKHDNYLLNYVNYWASIGWNFYPTDKITIKPFFSISGEVFAFDGKNGYTQYAFDNGVSFWDPDLPKEYCKASEYPDGCVVISYSQQRYLYDLGIQTKIDVGKKVDYLLWGKIGFFNQVIGHDCHWSIKKYKEYADVVSGFMFSEINIGSELSFKLNKHNQLSLKTDIQEILPLQGDTYSRKIGESEWNERYSGGGGASSNLVSVSLNYTFTF